MPRFYALSFLLLLGELFITEVQAFLPSGSSFIQRDKLNLSRIEMKATRNDAEGQLSRRQVIQAAAVVAGWTASTIPATAAERQPLDALLYRILRVREATQQEARLINSGKFKDLQRANVKLAVRFMVENYRLADAFVGASSYLSDTSRRVEAGQIGQSAVQNLYTILEYFDAAGVENIKVRVA